MANFTPQEIEQFLQQFFDTVGARQYVGARYVPIFGRAGSDTVEWDDTAPYEPLTVVMHQGVSYVSRRYVPAGIPITDTGYWVETYRFNAQVEQYRQEVLAFDGRITDNAQAISDEADAREAADTRVLETVADDYVPFPDSETYPKYGTSGQVLSTLANGGTQWVDPVVPSDEQAEAVITDWLDDHPEATTTVQDNSLTVAKFANSAINTLSTTMLTMGDSRVVVLDTANKTLTIPAGSTVMHPLGRYSVTSDVVLDLNIGSSDIKIVFDTADNTFKAQIYATNSTKTQQIIACLRVINTIRSRVSANFPYRIDNLPYGIVPQVDVVPADSGWVMLNTSAKTLTFPAHTIIVSGLTRYELLSDTVVDLNVGSSALKIVFDTMDNTIAAQTFVANSAPSQWIIACVRVIDTNRSRVVADFPYMIDNLPYGITPQIGVIPADSGWVRLDTTAKTLTFPRQTTIVGPRTRHELLADTVVDLDIGSSALKVVFDMADNTIKAQLYSANTGPSQWIIACLRVIDTNRSRVSAAFPYMIDGRPYGLPSIGSNPYEGVLSIAPQHVRSVCHRGLSLTAPENTIPAFVKAKARGFEYVETDVRYTSDGVPVLLHDATINRTARNADGTEIQTSIAIDSITYAQALDYDFGIWKGAEYAGTRIPTFEQFMKVCHDLSIHPYVEIKDLGTDVSTRLAGLLETATAYGMHEHITFNSFIDSYLTAMSALDDEVELGLATNELTAAQVATMQTIKASGNPVVMSVWGGDTNAPSMCIAAGLPLQSWTYNNASFSTVPDYASSIVVEDAQYGEYQYNQYIGAL